MKYLSKLSDEEVVEIVRTKNKEMYAEIIRRYQVKLMRYASYILTNDHMASDAVQEGFIKAYISLNGFDIKKKFSSWIYRIVHNEGMNLLNKVKRQRPIEEGDEFDSGVNIEDEFVKKELINHTYKCLEQMDLIYREPLSLFYLEEKSYEEISDILRLPIGTVGTRVNRAKGIMKKICQKLKK